MISDEEKLWLYAHCDAFLFPSTLEGFGIPVLEAMRFGARVVSSRHTCLPEVCACHAAYWSSSDPEHMAEVVRKAINGWDRQSAQAAAARQHSLQFSYDHYTKQYVQLYCQLLGISR
jgi:glycosyltransferase involved in cell wall biosynthesis